MKKFAMFTVFALTLGFLSPMLPAVQASSVTDEILIQAVSQNPTAARVQELLSLKEQWDQGNRSAVLGALAQTAAEQTGRSDLAGVAATIVSGDNLGTAVQTALRDQVELKLTERLGSYKEGLTLLASLFQHSSLDPQPVQDNNSLTGAPQNYRKMIQMSSTAYGPGMLDNDRWVDRTFMGGLVRKGVVAVDPMVIPMGTKVWVEGYGEAVAEDQGSAIKGNRIDLAFDTRQEALGYGMKPVRVYILN